MKKTYRKYSVLILAACLPGLLAVVRPAYSDYKAGVQAYNHYDYQTARREFTQAAGKGHIEAQYYLGEIYEGGIGVPIDYPQAVEWYTQAAQQQHAAAQARLARLYLMGWGTKRDANSAFSWYLRSAENGYPLAQFETGLMYARAQGTPLNKIEAYRWLTTAASYGDPKAMVQRDRLSGAMTPVEMSRASHLASEWEYARERQPH